MSFDELVQTMHKDVKTCPLDAITEKFRKCFESKLYPTLLFAPLEAYGKFSAIYGCVTKVDQVVWTPPAEEA